MTTTCDPVTGEPERLPIDMHAASREADLLDLETAAAAFARIRQRRGLTPHGAGASIGTCTAAEVAEIASFPGGHREQVIGQSSFEDRATATVDGLMVTASVYRLLTEAERGRLRDAILGNPAVR